MCVPAQVTVGVCVRAYANDCMCARLLPLFRQEAGNQGFLTDLKPQLQVLEISGERKAKLAKCS